MASIFIIGEKGDPQLWLVDTAKGTVQAVKGGAGGVDVDFVEIVQNMRKNDFALVKNVDVAVASGSYSDFTSRQLSENG